MVCLVDHVTVYAAGLGYAIVQAATLALAGHLSGSIGNSGYANLGLSASRQHVGFSNAGGGLANLTADNANGRSLTEVTVDGRNETDGVSSAGSDATNTTAGSTEIFSTITPSVMTPPESDPTAEAPAVRVVSPAGEEGAVRLVNRVDVNGFATGALQVFFEGAWGAVCTTNFDQTDATVACRQLGYPAGIVQPQERLFNRRVPDPEVVAPFLLENLGCSGNEARLVDCPVVVNGLRSYFSTDYYDVDSDYQNAGICDPFAADGGTFARVACGTISSAEEGDVRLANSVLEADGTAEYGRLEVFHNGGWGTVCARDSIDRFSMTRFDAGAADVACRQLGFQQGFQIQKLEDDDEAITARIPIVLTGLQCNGTEQAITACPAFGLFRASTICRHTSDVHLVCHNGPNPEMDGATRLMNGSAGPGYEYGRLEIFERGFWSNVCNEGRFTPDAAQVACRALGYDGGAVLRFRQPYELRSLSQVLFKDLPVALAAVDCNGTEDSITECQSNDRRVSACTNFTSSTVLACANSGEGCDRQEGTTEGAVRLRGGFGTPCDPIHSGFIEVLHDGEWGSICTNVLGEGGTDGSSSRRNEGEEHLVADVVCRQLGFPHGTRIDPLTATPPPPVPEDSEGPFSRRYYSDFYADSLKEEAEEPVERFWLTNVACSGVEGRLFDCDLGPGFLNDNTGCRLTPHRMHIACRQFPVVQALEALTDPDAEEGDLRLVDEAAIANWATGLLQVFFEGSWSQVCGGLFGAADATVACRQLGLGAGTIVPQILSDADLVLLGSTTAFPEVAITASGCTGSEERLIECGQESNLDDSDRIRRDSRGCQSATSAGLRIACVGTPGQGDEGEFRLTDTRPGGSPESESGILEVFHAGAWGTLCDRDFFTVDNTAQVACRDVGFETGFFRDEMLTSEVLPPWLSGIRCEDADTELSSCQRSAFGDTSSCGTAQRLFCLSSRQDNGRARLVGGSADAGGAWEYGRLEVLIDIIWTVLGEERDFDGIGRRGAQVACRSLGFDAGAQPLVGRSSPFPGPPGSVRLIRRIECNGSEASLSDCDIEIPNFDFGDDSYSEGVFQFAAALICTNPSGCEAEPSAPSEGDVRLVPLVETAVPTAVCDEVHFGGVELFREGVWGRVCRSRSRFNEQEFTLDAQVVCRQLGFPFGTVMDGEAFSDGFSRPEDPTMTVWATEAR